MCSSLSRRIYNEVIITLRFVHHKYAYLLLERDLLRARELERDRKRAQEVDSEPLEVVPVTVEDVLVAFTL